MSQREILFKAKRTDNGEWVEGWYCKYPFFGWQLKPCIIPSAEAEDGEHKHVEVDPSTVCQYIGKIDERKTKIFEGDRVKVKYLYLHESKERETSVSWCEEDCSFTPFNWEYECDGCDCYLEIESLEVIGNIHDN